MSAALTRCVVSGVAVWLASGQAWGHTFPPARTVVAQVESCELVVMVGYRPGSGEATEAILARVANSPKSRQQSRVDALREVLTSYAMAPLTITVDGHALVPTIVRAKVGVETGGARPMVVVLVTYALALGHTLAIASHDVRNTRISWQDRSDHRVDLAGAPAQDHWYDGVASFLLNLSAGSLGCATHSSP
ncbi:MAG: hypothetical protein ABI591_05450 [Kofleriaceae bacterium]